MHVGQGSLAGYSPWGRKRVGHDLATKQQQQWVYMCVCVCVCVLYVYIYACKKKGHGNSLQYSCLENPMDRAAWLATIHRVAQSDTTEAT